MELWRGALRDFVHDADSGAIAGQMLGRFYAHHLAQPSDSEVRSWEYSLRAVARVTRDQAEDIGVAVEYHLPLSGRRIDVMLFGHSAQRSPNSLVVELKQWSRVALEDPFTENVLVEGYEHAHPSQQAKDYVGFLKEVHSSFVDDHLFAQPCAYCHNLAYPYAEALEDRRFADLLQQSPLFKVGDDDALAAFIDMHVGGGEGIDLMQEVSVGRFKPSKKVLDCLDAVLNRDEEWHLIDNQRVAYNAILAQVRRQNARRGRSAILVRGGPGTGKTVIAIQLLADAMRLGFTAAHSTGGKAFTTALRSKFKGADSLFIWNMNVRKAPFQGLDLLLVDEAHRIRRTSDIRWTPKKQRNSKPQVQELIDASKVTVFFLDENQFVRPDEEGQSMLIREAAASGSIPLKEYDLQAQFRCGGCTEYVEWVDYLLGFRTQRPPRWGLQYRFEFAGSPEELELLIEEAEGANETARMVAGFCWKWSDPLEDDTLVPDVVVGEWRRPWNRKRNSRRTYRPENDPYTLWAQTRAGEDEVGCIYSAQGFEFDRVGVIWGPDLLWRENRWVAQPKCSYDVPVRSSTEMMRLVRNAYRVLLTRGMKGTRLLCLDPETREHIVETLQGMQ